MILPPELILEAYRSGLFPMADSETDPDVFWVEPKFRGIFPLKGFHVSRSLSRKLRRDQFRVTLNADFPSVMAGCAQRERTWINAQIKTVFCALHDSGHAHSVEVWNTDGRLVGGIYGLALHGAFFGESMFSRETDASKVALAWLTSHLTNCGFSLFDTQFITDHLASLGAIEIPRAAYLERLESALQLDVTIHDQPWPVSGQDVVQRRTQTS